MLPSNESCEGSWQDYDLTHTIIMSGNLLCDRFYMLDLCLVLISCSLYPYKRKLREKTCVKLTTLCRDLCFGIDAKARSRKPILWDWYVFNSNFKYFISLERKFTRENLAIKLTPFCRNLIERLDTLLIYFIRLNYNIGLCLVYCIYHIIKLS